jgi:glyoxylase-like metal-dependent hydrolase (beta-lactamase superfamily II)
MAHAMNRPHGGSALDYSRVMNASRIVVLSALAVTSGTLHAFDSEALAPRVHLLTQGDVFHVQPRGNVSVIEQRKGIVLVDSGGSPAAAAEVVTFVRSRTAKPVIAIILTHWHGDHVLGVSRLLQEWPKARVISTVPTRDMLARPEADAFMPGDNAEANSKFHRNVADSVGYLTEKSEDSALPSAVRAGFKRAAQEYAQFGREMQSARRRVPTETFTEAVTLPDDDVPVEVRFLGRANTEGDAIAWLPRQRIVITGDVVVAPIPFGFNSYPAQWIEVLGKIQALDYVLLAPGHGSAIGDKSYVDRLIAMIADVRTQVAAGAREKVNLDAARDTFAGEDPWLRLWFQDYWVGPITTSAVTERAN